MDNRLDRFESKLDKLVDNQTEMAITQSEIVAATKLNTDSLEQHMSQTLEVRKQTTILFEGITALKQEMDKRRQEAKDELSVRLQPIEQTIDRVKFSFVLVGGLGSFLFALAKLGVFSRIFHIQ